MQNKYQVFDYSSKQLVDILSNVSEATESEISSKSHIEYFNRYFSYWKAKTIVAEYEYIDKDYIEDYAAYYVRSFHEYKRLCCRLHFFDLEFKEENFKELLIGTSGILTPATAQFGYLGFMVVKPLPQTVIGKTCLKTYYPEGHRYYPIIRDYSVNLFGIKLTVETLAYQEQDSIVAACASSAIWSAFQGTGVMFQHSIPSPVEITKAATIHFPYSNRHFPNKGLTPDQMAHAIRNVGLDPFLINCTSADSLTSNAYAYLKGGIPLIFGMGLHDVVGGKIKKTLGKHAATITGYNLSDTPKKFDGTNFFLKSSRINKIYVHDDRVGPFARMDLDGKKADSLFSLSSSIHANIRATPDLLILPLYHKIRIPFKTILNIIYLLDYYTKDTATNVGVPVPEFEWNIYLSDVRSFKTSIFNTSPISVDHKYDILTTKMPRFIWRAICEIGNQSKIEFLFDATDIEQGKIFIRFVEYDPSVTLVFKTIAEAINIEAIEECHVRTILNKLRAHLQ
jgi:hypothetical protein